MKNWIVAISIASIPAVLSAQNPGASFQYVITGSGPGGPMTMNKMGVVGKVVTGKPFSATEERHSLQILGDGTRIESKTSDKFYRDDQGRTRTEREDGTVMIDDPVSGTGFEINGNNKVVRHAVYRTTGDGGQRLAVGVGSGVGVGVSSGVGAGFAVMADSMAMQDKLKAELASQAEVTGKVTKMKDEIRGDAGFVFTTATGKVTSNEVRNEENLGLQVTNGISAEGTRVTTTIPLGQIGNDRPINVVSERWFSADLQMLIRSTNKDPRFGDTTYELTNILQGAPDPTLFVPPANSHQ
jgi:hypothetical protein